MKDLLKIYRRYILTAAATGLLILFFNLALFVVFQAVQFGYKMVPGYEGWNMEGLSAMLTLEDGSYSLSEDGCRRVDTEFAFAMLIGREGQILWSRNLPEDIPRSYSLTDIASMSRWYLMDYPVKIWTRPDGLFVAAPPKGSLWKHRLEFPASYIKAFPVFLLVFFLGNLLLAFALAFLFGHRFYTSLKPLAKGIESLEGKEVLHLPERGIAGSLAGKLNQVSEVLFRQNQLLKKRDDARTSWIAGVSHDIRTPLSLIMGHGDSLSKSSHLSPEEQKEALSIQENSLQIKKLIADLNLASKLEYNSCPLRLKPYAPAALLRSLAAWYMNNVPDSRYPLTLDIEPALESIALTGDPDLLSRAFRNLTDNSIRHNPTGCILHIDARLLSGQVQISFSDTGKGIPVGIVKTLYRPAAAPKGEEENISPPHIMGLRIVKQIVEAHGGTLKFELQKDICRTAVILLPAGDIPPE